MLPHSEPLSDVPREIKKIWFQIKICSNTITVFYSTWHSTSAVVNHLTVVLPPVLSTVISGVRRSEPVVHNYRPLCQDIRVVQKAGQLLTAVLYYCSVKACAWVSAPIT